MHWPNASAGNFLHVAPLVWHTQRLGDHGASKLLLLHGTGASTHSFRDLMPMLAKHFDVLAIDLPGHGFTTGAKGKVLSLPGMASAIGDLLEAIDFAPEIVAGHSAGAAILIQMALDKRIDPSVVVGFNSALEPIEGNAIFSPLAKALFVNPFTAHTVAWQARYTHLPRRLLANTGSGIDDKGIDQYETLMRMPDHVAGALGMMANWDLKPLQARLATLQTPTVLIANEDDRMVPARVSRQAAMLAEKARFLSLPEGGHLAHEANPGQFADLIAQVAADADAHPATEAAQ